MVISLVFIKNDRYQLPLHLDLVQYHGTVICTFFSSSLFVCVCVCACVCAESLKYQRLILFSCFGIFGILE